MSRTKDEIFERYGILRNARNRGRLELELRGLVRLVRSLRRELGTPVGLPLRRRVRAWRNGFTSLAWVLYGLPENDPSAYLGDLFLSGRAYKINGFANPILGDKLVLSHLLAAHGLPHPTVVGTVLRGRLVPESRSGPGAAQDRPAPDNADVLAGVLARHPRVVFRPTWSGAGEGVFFVDARDGQLRLNGRSTTRADLCALLDGLDRYVATEFVDQAAYARDIFPDATNTLRILTLWDETRAEPFIAAVTHRFGSRRSAPLDNWHQGRGGLVASVDRRTGTLGPGVTLTDHHTLVRTADHPDTAERIEGVTVPGLSECLHGLLDAAARFPFCPLIGWDVVITDTGHRIIEANPSPGLYVWQVHVPLLADPRTRAFFQRHGLVATG